MGKSRVSVDGTDFLIYEPSSSSPRWFSHKFKGPGLSMAAGNVVWGCGPFPCGECNDLTIYPMRMKHLLDPEEKVIGDKGYLDTDSDAFRTENSMILARNETVNRRLKQILVLGSHFNHPLSRHAVCFYAVLNLVELLNRTGDPLFSLPFMATSGN